MSCGDEIDPPQLPRNIHAQQLTESETTVIKVTLPNGVVVEGDSAQEVSNVIDFLHADPPKREKDRVIKVVSPPIQLPASGNPTYPHRTDGNGKGCIKIGARQNQILTAAKSLAEQAGERYYEFKAAEIAELLGIELSIVSSALNKLYKVRAVRHGKNRCRWAVTSCGWTAHFRITQPIRAND